MDNQERYEYTVESEDKRETKQKRGKDHTLTKILIVILTILGMLLGLFKCGSSKERDREDKGSVNPPPRTEQSAQGEVGQSLAVFAAFTAEPMAYVDESKTMTTDESPVAAPTVAPAAVPTSAPTVAPVAMPTIMPVIAPTTAPVAEPTTAPVAEPTAAPTPQATLSPMMRRIVEPAMKEIVDAASTPKPMVYRTLTDEEMARIEANRPRELPTTPRILQPGLIDDSLNQSLPPPVQSGAIQPTDYTKYGWPLGFLAVGLAGAVTAEAFLESEPDGAAFQ
jgi:hypothetical protein